jgi:hypothetical protein
MYILYSLWSLWLVHVQLYILTHGQYEYFITVLPVFNYLFTTAICFVWGNPEGKGSTVVGS